MRHRHGRIVCAQLRDPCLQAIGKKNCHLRTFPLVATPAVMTIKNTVEAALGYRPAASNHESTPMKQNQQFNP